MFCEILDHFCAPLFLGDTVPEEDLGCVFGTVSCQALLRTSDICQKNHRVRKKKYVRNSGVGNGRANFMSAWKYAFFLQEKPMPIKFLVLGGGGILGFLGGKCRFYIDGRREDFF